MKKEDYMKLSKERLAELLEERDNAPRYIPPLPPIQVTPQNLPCFAEGGICSNPFHDCINCPRQGSGGYWTTSTGDAMNKK